MNTQSRRTLFAAGLITAALASGASGQQDQKLGKVTPYFLRLQCAGRVRPRRRHAAFVLVPDRPTEVRGNFTAGSGLRDGILGCGDGLPRQYLATTPTRAEAQAAWEALEKARSAGAKTQRERDWIEALSAYFRDHDKVASERGWRL